MTAAVVASIGWMVLLGAALWFHWATMPQFWIGWFTMTILATIVALIGREEQ